MKWTFALVLPAASLIFALGCDARSPVQPSAVPTTARGTANDVSRVATRSSASHSEQVVFSGDADTGSTFASGSGVEFWIWCEADSTNPYVGECNGAMRFDELGITRHVEDARIVETDAGLYTIQVKSTRDDAIDCTLNNTSTAVHGPANTVRVVCTTPGGSATATHAVVNVTGPSGD